MDRHALAILIPVIGMFFTGLIALSFTRLGRALATRLEGGSTEEQTARLARLEAESDQLRAELAEIQERLDFTERALARAAAPAALPPG